MGKGSTYTDLEGGITADKRFATAQKNSYHHGNLRFALVEAGLVLLEESGAGALSIRQLAKYIAVSQAAPYHHFPDKNALLAALAAEGFRRAGIALRRTPVKHPTIERRIRGILKGYVRFAQNSPELFRLMYGPIIQNKSFYSELVDASSDAFNALAKLIQEITEDFELPHVNVHLTTVSLLSLGHGLAHLIVDDRGSPTLADTVEDSDSIVEYATSIFVSGFKSSQGV